MSAQELLTQALQLPAEQRAEMAHQLLLSLEPEGDDADYESEWAQEIARRAKRVDDGQSQTVDWREAHEAIRRELRREKT